MALRNDPNSHVSVSKSGMLKASAKTGPDFNPGLQMVSLPRPEKTPENPSFQGS